MADYISRDYAVENMENFPWDTEHDKNAAIHLVRELVPAADVVARDCYDRILAENDTMREMLARIGKKCGDSMDDVRPVVRGEWLEPDDDYGYLECSVCEERSPNDERWNFCPNCGADCRRR